MVETPSVKSRFKYYGRREQEKQVARKTIRMATNMKDPKNIQCRRTVSTITVKQLCSVQIHKEIRTLSSFLDIEAPKAPQHKMFKEDLGTGLTKKLTRKEQAENQEQNNGQISPTKTTKQTNWAENGRTPMQ